MNINEFIKGAVQKFDEEKKPKTRKGGSHHVTGPGSSAIRKEHKRMSDLYKGEK